MKYSPDLGSKVSDLYKHTLDYGAHPNFLGHITTSDIKEENGSAEILMPGTNSHRLGLQTTVKIGVISLKIFELTDTDRFFDKGITEKLTSLNWAIEKT